MLTCQMTGRRHGMPTGHGDAIMTSSLSGFGTWVGSSGIRVRSAQPGEEDEWHALGASARVGRRLTGA